MVPRKIKMQSGLSMIEFTLILPILLVLLVGIIDISVMLYDKAVITHASREGARYGVVLRTPTYASSASVIAYTQAYTTGKLITFTSTPSTPVILATPSVSVPQFGDQLTVSISYTFTDLLLHYFINHSPQYVLTSSTTMSYE